MKKKNLPKRVIRRRCYAIVFSDNGKWMETCATLADAMATRKFWDLPSRQLRIDTYDVTYRLVEPKRANATRVARKGGGHGG